MYYLRDVSYYLNLMSVLFVNIRVGESFTKQITAVDVYATVDCFCNV
jgi:hypothetical protein